ncbi:glycopeptide antibiotics resistance protein [Lentilactobacillus senioris DSM 24302 = JCM 17472]|uniref:Glycopeptide antibiotics resistance protein n=1 Tax=Lentilactobacillus senioris DSM 24302 = JCM 17472 TaxID=1423802 RepID=A0A0R2D1F4_9LACO|nr:VanZ family protein [Lentilactobacillus senioris]KRM94251.1 glycopeptide antibiotics resistance protein [Lentilactobacillus senioris DSM 24302 = JCM 17472]
MSAYVFPIVSAFFTFIFIALLAVIPYAVLQYRKYGSISKLKVLIVFSFSFYLICAYYLIILPLPSQSFVAHLHTPWMQLVPFNALHYFITNTVFRPLDPSTYVPALKQSAFLQPFFNFMLTVPFGLYLRYFWKLSFKKVVLASFCLSLFFELTQLSGLYFIYPRPYRLFDVDDLILNTLGGTCGYLIEPLFAKLFPPLSRLNYDAEQKRNVASFSRRAIAFVIDWIILLIIFIALGLLVPQLGLNNYLSYLGGVFIYFVILPYFSKGTTIGKGAVKISLVAEDESAAGFLQLLFRQFLFYGLALGNLFYFIPLVLVKFDSDRGSSRAFYFTILAIAGIALLLFLLDILVLMFKQNSKMFYEHMTNTREIGH